jgi:N-acetylglutamate synthase-like GNAT family acetyltransferase/8-oxo-dGTP pyrophosphatase MutT (NUDIX family)
LHERRFNSQDFYVIQVSGKDIGIIAVVRQPDHIKVNQMFILPEYQSRGIGAKCMNRIIQEAKASRLPVRLQVLKVNPRAAVLYKRLGFKKTGETRTHNLMEKPPREKLAKIRNITDFTSKGTESGVALALRDEEGRYLFCLAGTRHNCPPGELFYGGLGGHREQNEDWLTCAHREALEEMGVDIQIISSSVTWQIRSNGRMQQLNLSDEPRPLALNQYIYFMDNYEHDYRIVVYEARMNGVPKELPPDELRGIIALTSKQVVRGANNKPTIAQLLAEGTILVTGRSRVDLQARLYPLGTAIALAKILNHTSRTESLLA